MSDKELTQALRRVAVETGSLLCLGCGYENGCGIRGCAIIRAAAERLEALTAPPTAPLTLEELREMAKKKPVVVWMVHLDEDGQDYGEWAMFLSEENIFIGDGTCWGTKNYGTAFVAYRCKPEEGQPWRWSMLAKK